VSSDIRASVVTPLSPKDPPLQPHQCGTSRSEGQHAVLIHPDGADPWAASDGGFIYYTQTTGADVQLWVSHELQAIRHSSSFQLWCPYEHERLRLNNLWAPELHYLHGAWYLYVAADDGRNHNHRMYVLESCRGPAGPFKLKGKLSPPHQDRWAIDGTVTFIKGELYYAWSGWPSSRNGRQNLYLAKMDNPWTLTRHMSCISTPQYKWESWINEGPQFLHRGSDTFLVYSANKSWTDDYKLGLLSLQGADPLSPSSWVKRPDPIFDSAHHGEESIHAPGHCSFFTDKHGENWLLYHVAKTKGSGWEREVRAQRWIWGDNGEPHFGRPLPIKRSHPELASVLFDIKCR
jgi:GH43 family beta-xylosidase